MSKRFQSVEEIAARSRLMPTAGEFYPRSLATQPPNSTRPTTGDCDHPPSGSSSYRGNEYYTRNRDPKSSKKDSHRFKKTEREVVERVSDDGPTWRDRGRQDHRRRDSWYTNEFQAHSPINRLDVNRNGEVFDSSHRRSVNSRDRHSNQGNSRVFTSREGQSVVVDDSIKEAPARRANFYRNKNPDNYNPQKNFRQRDLHVSREGMSKEGGNQMEVLIGQLIRGTLECLVCCEQVRQSQPTWSCRVCYHVLHLRCVVQWANASRVDDSWKCPACRRISTDTPKEYRCFCAKTLEPQWNRSDCPHTCGSVCGLSRSHPCPHKCTLPCHPGPCPPCHQYVTRECGCGRVSRTVPCSDTEPVVCGAICDRPLNCGQHQCKSSCHGGQCDKCVQLIKQECYCGRSTKEVACASDSVGVTNFSCDAVCAKKLLCQNHDCVRNCHKGPCAPCALLPEYTQCCPCGKSEVKDLNAISRRSCLDPIPTCGRVCGKILDCGEPGFRHECNSPCHEGGCPPCPKDTTVRCRCGHMNRTISCSDLLARADDTCCDKKCNKSRKCGKHKCRELCCIDIDHVCPLPCNKMLSCGSHRCEALCHPGYCRPCTRDAYQELACSCGAQVIPPPVPCGTRPPDCSQPCSRTHACAHPPTHNCHDLPHCPPCIVLVEKLCFGGHELRSTVFCHLEGFSCGLACGKPLPCGRHTCLLPCHTGVCLQSDASCTQRCTLARSSCGHACNAPCHDEPCPDIPCKEVVKVTCECGLRFASRACVDHSRDYQRIVTVQLASKMADLAAGGSIDLNSLNSNKKMSFKTLECNDECKLVERNRRLAVGLQIRNPDLSSKLTPKYSDFLRQWGKRDSFFCQMVHEKLTSLVQLAKQSKQKSRSYSFDSMNREKRQFIHDYCEHFGCEAVAYDQEPNRNVVATANRDTSWLPGLSLLEVLQRENGARKVPLPSNVNSSRLIPTTRFMEVLPVRASTSTSWRNPPSATSSTLTGTSPAQYPPAPI